MTKRTGVFADHAPIYAALGLRVFPTGGEDGKRPLIKRWQTVGTKAVHKLTSRFPDANIGVIDGDLITRVDIDDPKLVQGAIDRFGDTPVHVRTPSGGMHYWYASSGERRVLGLDGLKIDILGKGGFGVAPPSIHPGGMTYSFVHGGPEDIRGLPNFKRGALPDSAYRNPKSSTNHDGMNNLVGRNDTLFKRALRMAPNIDTKSELLFQSAALNECLFDSPLDEGEVQKIVDSAWQYNEADQIWIGREARAVLTATELNELGGNASAALLLLKLKVAHGWRNGRVFPLANALAAAMGWGLPRFRTAKEYLVERRFIEIKYVGGNGPHDPPYARLLR